MMFKLLLSLVLCFLSAFELQGALVYTIPIEGPVGPTQVFILRRALKEAAAHGAKGIILEINTPGGEVSAMLEMLGVLENYTGTTWAYVNHEAMSAGAYLAAACERIYFSPHGIMGAAAAIQSTGEDIGESARLKLESYLKAKLRSFSHSARYRADVLTAMMDKQYVLEINGHVIKPAGELLSLTAKEAIHPYGEPPEPLLATGIAISFEDLVSQASPEETIALIEFEPTGAEVIANWLQLLAPVLMGIGFLCLFIEFKTPGFGIFGIGGIGCFGLVFFGQYIAGLAGYEGAIALFLGIGILFGAIFLIPGTLFLELLGLCLLFGGLIWIVGGFSFEAPSLITWSTVSLGIGKVLLGLFIAVALVAILGRFLPKKWAGRRMVLENQVGPKSLSLPAIGALGFAATPFMPTGNVMIDGRLYEARVEVGQAPKGAILEVVGIQSSVVIVVVKSSSISEE